MTQPLTRREFDIAQLMEQHPPRWRDRNKAIVFSIACPSGSIPSGKLVYSRWPGMQLPDSLEPLSQVQIQRQPDVYDYTPLVSMGRPAMEWHVNFADPLLFVAYASELMAQDEMQVAEHPVLGSVREALLSVNERPLTQETDTPTPVLIRGALRCAAIATHPDATQGRPKGIYGNRFAEAEESVIRRATTRIDPPSTTNLIAIAAPSGGYGEYSQNTIRQILTTAYSGFKAAQIESRDELQRQNTVVIHTGFWGCGAFGGNRKLMTIAQIIAARLAGVQHLIFHTVDQAGLETLDDSIGLHDREFRPSRGTMRLSEILERIEGLRLRWGISDGN